MAAPNARECHICRLPLARITPSHHNECPFCERAFSRVDGAKRHARICPSRNNRPLPQDFKRGRKVHACDVCSRVKVSCDSKLPCKRCASRSLNCSYARLCTDPTHFAISVPGGRTSTLDKKSCRLPFLLACTDPSVGPVDEVIVTRESKQDQKTVTARKVSDDHDTILDTIDPRLLLLNFTSPSFSMDLDYGSVEEYQLSSTPDRLDQCNSDEELWLRISLLEEDLRQIVATEFQRAEYPSIDLWESYFTALNFRDCIKAFFQMEQLLATIVHRPTFHPGTVDTTLLLAIVISGSTYLHYRRGTIANATFALVLRELAEKHIFRRVEALLGSTLLLADSQRVLETCQAAYIITTLQSCVKSSKIRQRVITRCHPILVELVRSVGTAGGEARSLGSERNWHVFVYNESCNRLFHWLFINDAWFTLLSNHPPAMTILEMSRPFPCEDTLWNVGCAASFGYLRTHEDHDSDLPCCKMIISRMLRGEWKEETAEFCKRLSVKHFLVIILGESSTPQYDTR